MPHVVVKVRPGQSERQKARLADNLAKDVSDILGCGEESVSVVIEELKTEDRARDVHQPELLGNGSSYAQSVDTSCNSQLK